MEQIPASNAGDWPLPVPEEVGVRALLPAAADSWPALRLTCRKLRQTIDSIKSFIVLSRPMDKQLGFLLRALPRLTALLDVVLCEVDDGGVAAFAALALPHLPQLTALEIHTEDDDYGLDRMGHLMLGVDIPERQPAMAPCGAMVLASQLSLLQRLEEFEMPGVRGVWGDAAADVALQLARLPALRDLKVKYEMGEDILRHTFEELGDNAWRSLEALDTLGWDAATLSVLAEASLTRLTNLALSFIEFGPGDCFGSILSRAVWAPQLLELSLISEQGPNASGLLSDLRLPNLKDLSLGLHHPSVIEQPFTTGWHLPKLERLAMWPVPLSQAAAVALANLELPGLTRLRLTGSEAYRYPPPVLATLLRDAVWMRQLQDLLLSAPEGPGSAKAWAALATLPRSCQRCVI